MNKNLQPIDENERNINWEEVEYKIAIICNKFTNIDNRYRDDLAQELRIHAYYVSDDYYNLQRKAIDFWRTLKVKVMPEIPYFDLSVISSIKEDDNNLSFEELINKLKLSLMKKNSKKENKQLAAEILEIILDDLIVRKPKINVRKSEKYQPYYRSQRISCSYLWEVMGDEVGAISYKDIRKAVKLLESTIKELAQEGEIAIDDIYFED